MANRLQGLTAFERHKRLLREAEALYGGTLPTEQPQTVKTDHDTLRENYRFLRTEEDDKNGAPWEVAVARKYYSMLFREYAIIDLSRYKEDKFGCRWRTSKEVVSGKGQFTCGAKGCNQKEALETFEVPFAYVEAQEPKQALVKVRLCQEHSMQLNHKKNMQLNQKKATKKRKSDQPAERASKHSKKFMESSSPKRRGDSATGQRRTDPTRKAPSEGNDIEAEVDKFLKGLFL